MQAVIDHRDIHDRHERFAQARGGIESKAMADQGKGLDHDVGMGDELLVGCRSKHLGRGHVITIVFVEKRVERRRVYE